MRRANGEGSKPAEVRPGLWRANIRVVEPDGTRKRLSVYGATSAACRDNVLAIRNRVAAAEPTKDSPATLSAYLTQWLEDVVRPSVRPATLRSYEGIVRNHLGPRLGSHRLGKLTAAHVQHAIAEMERAGASPRTRELALVVLRAALERAVQLDLIRKNPADRVERPRKERREMRVWTPLQVAAFLTAAQGDRLYMLYRVALATGMRQGELLGLRWPDIDLDGARINVQYTMDPASRKLAATKTARGRRPIPLSPSTVAELRAHFDALPKRHPKWVFHDGRDGPLRPSNVYRRSFKPLVAKAGVPLIRFHDLRHTFATLALSAGVHVKVVQEMLGHATVAITIDTYSHVLASLQADAPASIDLFLARSVAANGGTNGGTVAIGAGEGKEETLTV